MVRKTGFIVYRDGFVIIDYCFFFVIPAKAGIKCLQQVMDFSKSTRIYESVMPLFFDRIQGNADKFQCQ